MSSNSLYVTIEGIAFLLDRLWFSQLIEKNLKTTSYVLVI